MERKRKGRKSTILTGPLGVEEEAETERKNFIRIIMLEGIKKIFKRKPKAKEKKR